MYCTLLKYLFIIHAVSPSHEITTFRNRASYYMSSIACIGTYKPCDIDVKDAIRRLSILGKQIYQNFRLAET